MKAQDKPAFATLMFWLAEKYPVRIGTGQYVPRELTPKWIEEYFRALSDLSIEAIRRGVEWHYGNSEFFPTLPGALRKSVESAPKPPDVRWKPPWENRVQIPEVTRGEAQRRLQEAFDLINARFETNLKA